jgi:hypothetical protein
MMNTPAAFTTRGVVLAMPDDVTVDSHDRSSSNNDTDTNILMNNVHDTKSAVLSKLNGAADQLFISCIATYLDFSDVCNLTITCRYFSRICLSPAIWSYLYDRDFNCCYDYHSNTNSSKIVGGEYDYISNIQMAGPCLSNMPNNMITMSKRSYLDNHAQRHARVLTAKQENIQFQTELLRAARRRNVEDALDYTQLRAVAPLCLMALFLSITLFCQKVDGLDVSYWVCCIPIFISLGYFAVCVLFVKYVHYRREDASSIFYQCWTDFSGPIVFFVRKVLHKSPTMIALTFACTVLSILQVALIAVKLSKFTPLDVQHGLSWGWVFLPVWCLFSMFCALPASRVVRQEIGIFVSVLLLVWIPFFIFFVCLTVKLYAQEYHSGNHENLGLVFIFIPFWIIEGIAMLAALLFLAYGIYQWRRGHMERSGLSEHIIVLCVTWFCLAPFVSFQSMLCVRDDNQLHPKRNGNYPSASETVTPMLVVLGGLTIFATLVSFSFRSTYQVRFAV